MPERRDKLPRAFGWLNATQFFGALNDNIFKLLLVFLLLRVLGDEHRTAIITAASAVFVAPFLLFSNAAGVLADRMSKQRIIAITKWMEVVIMSLGCLAVFGRSPVALYAILFLMCTQSALFGPSKFGILPELIREQQLSRANGLLVGFTYLAIIIGSFLPSFALDMLGMSHLAIGAGCVILAVVGLLCTRGITVTPAAGSGKRISLLFLREITRTLLSIRGDRHLLLSVFAAAYFLFLGGFIQQNILLFGGSHLGLSWERSGYLFPLAAFGIAIGGLAAGRLSGRHIEFGVVPLGALGLAVSCILLGLLPPRIVSTIALIFLLGLCSGLFIVPLEAFIQARSPPQQRGEILAAANFLSFLGVALSAGLLALLNQVLGLSPRACFFAVGLLTIVLAVGAGRVLPDFFVRFVTVVFTRWVYRLRVCGEDRMPAVGGALLISNHVTWADAVLLSTLTTRRIRFVMSREIMEQHWLRHVFRIMHAIPVSADDPPRRVIEALREARAALDEGYLVCIFAEGALTRNGHLRAFRPGFERILKDSDYPIIPIYIGGAWGSIFSYYGGRLLHGLPRALPYPIWIAVGAPLPPTATAWQVRQAVLELSGDTVDLRKSPARSLPAMLVHKARRHWRRPALADSSGKRLSFGRMLTSAIALARVLEPTLRDQEFVGILLPASVGGALANLAVSLTGRVPVNLNFTASREAVDYALQQCNIRTTISSRAFLDKLEDFVPPDRTVLMEEIMPRMTRGVKLRALCAACMAPAACLMKYRRPGPDDLATVIFSSGSTGRPKGVMQTHHNVLSNIEAFGSIFGFERDDVICGILPLFHSFGFTTTLWCPIVLGFGVCYHPNPMDASRIADLIREERLTCLLTTPTFLLAYIRRAKREDFASLRYVVTGAEKLKERVAQAFAERFGLYPRQGYGTTELSPAVSVCLEDFNANGTHQPGSKPGSVGHPIPGCAARVVDPATGDELPPGSDGLLLIKGPNVMRGYLNEPERTAEVLRDGWYNTGDVAHLDEDGFIFIVDRLSRFSKIGGEMVPHVALEETLSESLGATTRAIAVTAAADERKGEQLVVLYTDEAGDIAALQAILRDSDLPNLWKPREHNFVHVAAIPVLGSGKLDIMAIRAVAKAHVEAREGVT